MTSVACEPAGEGGGGAPPARDLLPGVELEVDTPLYGSDRDREGKVAVATHGSGFLAVWIDEEEDLFHLANTVRAARVTADGTPLDDGIALSRRTNRNSPVTNWGSAPDVASNASVHLVVWTENQNPSGTWSIAGARVDVTTGVVLDSTPFVISDAVDLQVLPRVASDGENFFVVWLDGRESPEPWQIYGARVDAATGSVLDPDGIRISTSPEEHLHPAVAWTGGEYLVVWQERPVDATESDWDVRARRLDGAGQPLDDSYAVAEVEGGQVIPRVASNGTGAFIVWTDTSDVTAEVYGTAVDGEGGVQTGGGFQLSNAFGDQRRPAITVTEEGYFVAWVDTNQSVI